MSKILFTLRYHWKAVLVWSIGVSLVVGLWIALGATASEAYVSSKGPLAEGQTRVTVILHLFCRDSAQCGKVNQAVWRRLIREAAQKWNQAGANFQFLTRAARADDDPCWTGPWELAVILASPETVCPSDFQFSSFVSDAAATRSSRRARIYFNTLRAFPDRTLIDERETAVTLLHELGHIIGLGHPDDSGQTVEAVMNSRSNYNELQPDDIAGIRALYPLDTPPPALTGQLENPSLGTSQSGVGLVSGWVCEAEELEVSFNHGPRLFVPYGSARADTADTCGDVDNGFGLLMNYNILGDGSHTVALYADGVLVDQAQFTVKTLGTEWLSGVWGSGTITLSDGKQVTVQWDESTQGFTILDYTPCVSQIAGLCGEDG